MIKVKDTLTVNATEEDIANGVPLEYCMCPIAQAVRREKGFPYVSVGEFITVNRGRYTANAYYDMPWDAIEFIRRFDNGDHVEPFTFTATIDGR